MQCAELVNNHACSLLVNRSRGLENASAVRIARIYVQRIRHTEGGARGDGRLEWKKKENRDDGQTLGTSLAEMVRNRRERF